uniref:Superoxide dismutase [Cu-Zn] n=1 Tax=Strongyloides papillosus TaxID=174720 RepID=A0A0N5C3M9_STREA
MLFLKFLILILPSLSLGIRKALCRMKLVTVTGAVPTKNIGTLTIVRLKNGRTRITGKLVNLPPGLHGFHIHENHSLANSCLAAGAHLNLRNMNHGGLKTPIRHEGDLGNIRTRSNGVTTIDKVARGLSFNGPAKLLRRTLVVHEKVDDLGRCNNEGSITVGNSGARIACCLVTPFRRHYLVD